MTGTRPWSRWLFAPVLACLMAVMLAGCTGRGGGYLPPGPSVSDQFTGTAFTGRATFGFSFSCERSSRSTSPNPPTGRLKIELAYGDQGVSPLLGAPFSIHGTVDTIDPVLESQVCIGQEPPPGGNELIFLGRYRLTSSPPPPGFPASCPTRQTTTTPLCRFEVIVRYNDSNLAPSTGDFFSIKLSSTTVVTSELELSSVFYARAGLLEGGNLTVD